MDSKAKVVCSIVGILGAVAAALGFAAEAKRIKASQVKFDYSGCMFPRSTALALGLGAAVTLFLSQIIIVFSTGCDKRSKYSKFDVNWPLAKLLSALSRIAFGIGFVLLLAGSLISNRDGGTEKTYLGGSGYVYVRCYIVKPGVFAGAATMCLASAAFGILYYLTLSSAKLIESTTTNPTDQATPNVTNPTDQANPNARATDVANYDVEQPQFPSYKPT